jgi:hypothetical protein
MIYKHFRLDSNHILFVYSFDEEDKYEGTIIRLPENVGAAKRIVHLEPHHNIEELKEKAKVTLKKFNLLL